jgi:ferredoxin
MRISVRPAGLAFDAEPSQTLLHAAEAAGVSLPSSCRNGTCRTCICRLLSGRVRHMVEWPGLSAEEKIEGWILPCVAQALEDVVLDAPRASAMFSD